ncbi:hypothetical protein K435DRAFT_877734 [Dendrothele bispora CBS 962.96]|uniref:DUF6589 domain-containing protein n=1 Tax=Dendrothele bispora (strain CBS 962.96) TaxID=1314807 RepID=A0A4S8KPL7_DENBC|nr:hypothetical protein K435DRAFT_877734 [Dendrothele bispora CBS 962.96]
MQQLIHPSVNPTDTPQIPARLAASANSRTRAKGVQTVTKEILLSFRISDQVSFFQKHAPLAWYLTECMAAPRTADGQIIERKRRPPSIIQVAALSSFVMARNQYANGYWALQNGIWHIACQSHVDVKRVECLKGISVHDTTARRALVTVADDSLAKLQKNLMEGVKVSEMRYRWVLDNIQQYVKVWEGGIGRENRLLSGCAGTAILIEDTAPGAFDLDDHITRLMKNRCQELTTEKIWASIDWDHITGVQSLHVLLAFLSFIPSLTSMKQKANDLLRSKYAIHRMRDGRKSTLIPLGTNSEKEIQTEGMKRAIHDFLLQSGFPAESASKLIVWMGGDGGSVLAMDRAKQYLALHYDPDDPHTDYSTLHNLLPTIGIWHTQATNQNTIAENHFGPAVTNDPSALSRSASCANFKRPTNFRDCGNYYPLQTALSTFWETQILYCWRIELGFPDHNAMLLHFDQLSVDEQPTFDDLLTQAAQITDRWVSLESISEALNPEDMSSLPSHLQFPVGTPFTPDPHIDVLKPAQSCLFQEEKDFEGDRVLANSIIFKWEYSLWIELAYAVPEGDIGCVWEIMKIWIFIFAGGSNTNYRDLLLKMYCLFRYQTSTDLKNAIWNNWLVNVTGELGSWIPNDLLQEHYNCWLESLVEKANGDFDNDFLRKVLSPNVEFFLQLKEEFETSLGLHHWSKSHTSPHLRAEYQQLLTMYREEELHQFRPKRSMGHAATNLFDTGIHKLKKNSLRTFLEKQTNNIDILHEMNEIRNPSTQVTPDNPPTTSPSVALSTSPSPPISDNQSRYNSDDNASDTSDSDTERDNQKNFEAIDDDGMDILLLEQTSCLGEGLESMPRIDRATSRLTVSGWSGEEEILDQESSDDELEEGRVGGMSDDEAYWEGSDDEM